MSYKPYFSLIKHWPNVIGELSVVRMTLGQRTHYPLVMAKEFYSIDPWSSRTSISWYPYLGQVDTLRADGAVNRLREGDGSRVKNV